MEKQMQGTLSKSGDNDLTFKKPNMAKEVWRNFRKSKSAMFGLVLFVLTITLCFIAPLFVPAGLVTEQNVNMRFIHPGMEYFAGTDNFGRDVFARLLYGGRTSITIGVVAAFTAMLLGTSLGLAASYYDRIDDLIMRCIDVLASIPSILMALAIVSAVGTSMSNVIVAITLSRIPAFVRVVRAAALGVVDQEYIEAARAGGTSDWRTIVRHILPNCTGMVIVQTTMSMATLILYAAGLSFLGLGIQPPRPEWGAMLSEARQYMRDAPYLMVYPGACIVVVTMSLNLIGDGLRDALDPRLKS